jgi:hypothetical protein
VPSGALSLSLSLGVSFRFVGWLVKVLVKGQLANKHPAAVTLNVNGPGAHQLVNTAGLGPQVRGGFLDGHKPVRWVGVTWACLVGQLGGHALGHLVSQQVNQGV